jgi:dolichyl-phosphate-mannose-protein mannosyltransferase
MPTAEHDSLGQLLKQPVTRLSLLFVLLLSFFTYFYNFQYPQGFFWDENYHVASAQKYLNGVFLMEQHPPLGKLLIAAGELLLDTSENDRQFIDTNYARGNFTDGFSITGYRFFPALLAWLTAPLLFLIFLIITRSPILSVLLSFLYIFDNALIVQARSAMLEGSLLFFITLAILLFLLLPRFRKEIPAFALLSFFFGASIGAAFMTKLTGLILILLVPALLIQFRSGIREIGKLLLFTGLGFLSVFIFVWHMHFALGQAVHPSLSDNGWFKASDGYQRIVREKRMTSPLSFPIMLRDSLQYPFEYSKGVSKLDLSKVGENGSPFFLWPIGARSINYRWAHTDATSTRYLYLQANPAVWLLGLSGVVISAAFLVALALFAPKHKPRQLFLIGTFFTLYLCYMTAMSQIDRVMYLYHYSPALLFSFILFALMVMEIQEFRGTKITEGDRAIYLTVFALCIFLTFQFYRPLTYFEPISDEAFQKRAILKLWNLHCTRCPREYYFVQPRNASPDS